MVKKQKLIISLSLISTLLLIMIVSSGCADYATHFNDGYKTYANDDYKFSIDYPETWDYEETQNSVLFNDPENGSIIGVAYVGSSSSVDDFLDYQSTWGAQLVHMGSLDFRFRGRGKHTSFNGYAAYEIENVVDHSYSGKVKMVLFRANDRLFMLAYGARSGYYYNYDLETANKIMESLTFNTD
jgi:hypothetical protein